MPLLMSVFKTLISRHFHTLLKPQNPLYFSHKSLPISSGFYNTTTSSPHIEDDGIETENGNEKQENKKAMDVMFKEAVGLCEKSEKSESEVENNELKRRLRELETEVRRLRADLSGKERVKKNELKKGKAKSLYGVFTNQPGYNERVVEETRKEPQVYKELSPNMGIVCESFVQGRVFQQCEFLAGE